MKTADVQIGEVYSHEDLGRVRVKSLPIDDPGGARVVILGGPDAHEERTVSVSLNDLSEIHWEPTDHKKGGISQKYL